MPTDNLMSFVSILAVLSASAERLVELIKGRWPALNRPQSDPVLEEKRKWSVNLLAIACCMITAIIACGPIASTLGWGQTQFAEILEHHWRTLLGLGLFAAGGSSFWNSVLGYLLSTKNIKKAEAEQTQTAQGAAVGRQNAGLGARFPGLGSQTF